jgi:hypothetical protein
LRLGDTTARSQTYQTSDRIEEHIALIRQQVQASLADPATRALAAAIVSGSFDSGVDPRTGESVPVISYHGRAYRGARSWADARSLCAMRDLRCEVTAIWNFLVLNVRYTQDQDGEDTYQTLRASLEGGAGDCDDMTIAFAALLHAVGFEDVIARVISLDGRAWAHIYPVVLVGRQWLVLDATERGKAMGWE